MVGRLTLLACLVAGVCAACDTLHPPVIYNGVEDAIEVHAFWSDGTESSGTIAPRAAAHLGRMDARLQAVVVSRKGETLLTLDEILVSEKAARGVVGLSIREDGPHELTKEDLDRVYARE